MGTSSGAKSADLPVEQPTKVDLIINLKNGEGGGRSGKQQRVVQFRFACDEALARQPLRPR
jgi:hypothetical protein